MIPRFLRRDPVRAIALLLTPMNRARRRGGSSCSWLAIVLPLVVAAAMPAHAAVRLHTLFTDHMVLQRDIAVPVWGWAQDGEKVTVEFQGQKVSTTTKDGRWMVRLKKLKAGGPAGVMTVTGHNTVTVKDVVVGEVWIASGQSNMEWSMRDAFEPGADIAAANNPLLRLYTVPKLKADAPVDNVKSSWQMTSSNSVAGFSAVAYYFGQSLQKALGVPVGMIHTSWGGSPAEVWMRDEILASNARYRREIVEDFNAQVAKLGDSVAQWEKEQAAAKAAGKPFDKPKPAIFWKPSELYNGMIAPLLPYAIAGAIWYQGESNADRAHQYRSLFADMIRNWRHDWNQGAFPFFAVQLAPFKAIQAEPAESAWAELREAQNLAAKTLPNVGVAVITDYGDDKDIHPRWKKPAGERLALLARSTVYHEKIVSSGPTLRRMKIDGDKAVLTFDHVGGGLKVGTPPESKGSPVWETVKARQAGNSQALVGFAIAGADRKFVWAKAELQGDKIIVSHPSVAKPVAVRYGWADCPVVNLFNAEGLPASPFRTDDWPMITAPAPAPATK
jgi:sialate O-acetylesterase